MARKFLTPIDLNKLELQNAAIQNLSTPPGSPSTGQVYYDTSASPYMLKIYNGASWVEVGTDLTQEEVQDIVDGVIVAGTGIGKSYDDNANTLTITNTGVTSLFGTASEVTVSASTGSVTISLPNTINADTSGNAATATALAVSRIISLTGDASGSASFNGTSDISIPVVIDSNSAVSSITGTANEIDVSASVGAVTISLPSTINADVNGNASTATSLQTARVIALAGDVSGSASFDGSASISINASIQPNSVALSTDTTGDYVASVSGSGAGINVSGSGEGASVTISNTGVTSLVGTANEIDVSASTGSVTISLPATINADLNGNAASATYATTAGTANGVAANSVALGTDTTGNYVASVSAGTGISVSGSGEGASVTVTNDGVVSVSGTANQVNVSASTGAVTFSLPQDIHTGANPTFAGATAGNIRVGITSDNEIDTSSGNLTIDSTGGTTTIDDNVVITGTLTVSGSATYVNTEIIELADNTIILNSNATGSASQDAGIEVERGTDPNVAVIWNETDDVWTLTNDGTNYHNIVRKYATSVGNSASTVFTVTHNLGTRDVVVNVYDNSTYDTVEVDVVRTSTSVVTLTFAVAPSTNAYRVVITG